MDSAETRLRRAKSQVTRLSTGTALQTLTSGFSSSGLTFDLIVSTGTELATRALRVRQQKGRREDRNYLQETRRKAQGK